MEPVPALVLASAFLSMGPSVLTIFTPVPHLPEHPALGVTVESLPTGWKRYGLAGSGGWSDLHLTGGLGVMYGAIPIHNTATLWKVTGRLITLTWDPLPWIMGVVRVSWISEEDTLQHASMTWLSGVRIEQPHARGHVWVSSRNGKRGIVFWIKDRQNTWWGFGITRERRFERYGLSARWHLPPFMFACGMVLEQGPLQTTVYGTLGLRFSFSFRSIAAAYQTHPYLQGRWAISMETWKHP